MKIRLEYVHPPEYVEVEVPDELAHKIKAEFDQFVKENPEIWEEMQRKKEKPPTPEEKAAGDKVREENFLKNASPEERRHKEIRKSLEAILEKTVGPNLELHDYGWETEDFKKL